MTYFGHTRVKKKRAKRFQSTKDMRRHDLELRHSQQEMDLLLTLARSRSLSLEEGKELNRLSTRVRRLKHKLGIPLSDGPEEIVSPTNISTLDG